MIEKKTATTDDSSMGQTELLRLMAGIDYSVIREGGEGLDGCVVRNVTCDSREVEENDMFVALGGSVTDGHRFVEQAAAQNCAVIVVEQGSKWVVPEDWHGVVLEVADSRQAYADIAENCFNHPASSLKLIGITGTNGKTTITYLVEDALTALGYRVGVIGTVNYRYRGNAGDVTMPSPFTTPEPMRLQRLLAEMAGAGVEVVLMEVSSHALEQQRIGRLKYDVAAFTNLSRDHLDYHGTMEQYFQAKTILFERHLKAAGNAVISHPMQPGETVDWSKRMTEFCRGLGVALVDCGVGYDKSLMVTKYNSTLQQTEIELVAAGKDLSLVSPLVGHFNVDNVVCALGICLGLGLAVEQVAGPLAGSHGAPGRLQRVSVDDGTDHGRPVVFVDYAHTPDALNQVLSTLKGVPHRDLFCVFGCGGDRDNGKRPVMGEIAGRLADVAIVTDDNPRTENPEGIRAQIVPGVVSSGSKEHEAGWLSSRQPGDRGFVMIGSRGQAIHSAVRAAGPEDIVVVAGKGHEKYQLGLNGKRFFDDCLEAETSLLEWNTSSVCAATGGKYVDEKKVSRSLGNVSTDSRSIEPGDIFVALRGDRFDGHDFLASVKEQGAGCVVVETRAAGKIAGVTPRVEVENTLVALADLARYRRRLLGKRCRQSIVGITGSCGKTTVKEMTAAILRRKWPAGPDYPENAVLQTRGNLNNLIGLPLSLLPLTPHHRAAVLEMGMNAPGEIARMVRTAEPDICCITNVHGVHLEGLQTIEGVARAKEELFDGAPGNATLIVNLDDRHIRDMASRHGQRKITFTASEKNGPAEADLYASDIHSEQGGVITFVLHRDGEKEEIHLYTVGLHNVSNALAAAAIATAAGADLQEIALGLADFRPADRRMVQLKTRGGTGMLNDTYNANPASMAAGLRTLVQMGGGNTAAVLGDMLELGDSAAEAHREIGRMAADLGVTYLATVGAHRKDFSEGALAAGMATDMVREFEDKDKAAEWIENLEAAGKLGTDDWILVKASRGLQMETIVARLAGKG